MSPATTGLARSVHVRLIAHAKRLSVDPNHVLNRYAVERLLYRLSRSKHADRFVLKGAMLMLAWFGEAIRPTRDVDLLGLQAQDDEALVRVFTEVCLVEVPPDGMTFDRDSIRVSVIRQEDEHGGRRITIEGRLGNARARVQVDVGYGDAVSPPATRLEYPSLLEFPRPRLRAYRPETVVAEKLHAMIHLGAINSRMRDFYDLWVIQRGRAFQGDRLVRAVRATFRRRGTDLPEGTPAGLSLGFAAGAEPQWRAFLAKGGLKEVPGDFALVITSLGGFLLPVLEAARGAGKFTAAWKAGGPWV